MQLRALNDDFIYKDGPLEPVRPKFVREAWETLPAEPYKPSEEELLAARKKRRLPPPTVSQALTGALIAGGCAYFLLLGVMRVEGFLSKHPLANNVPFGLTDDANAVIDTMVLFFGGLAVAMFAFTTVGLLVLTAKLLTTTQTPQE